MSLIKRNMEPVSYTHLDVYKRQAQRDQAGDGQRRRGRDTVLPARAGTDVSTQHERLIWGRYEDGKGEKIKGSCEITDILCVGMSKKGERNGF